MHSSPLHRLESGTREPKGTKEPNMDQATGRESQLSDRGRPESLDSCLDSPTCLSLTAQEKYRSRRKVLFLCLCLDPPPRNPIVSPLNNRNFIFVSFLFFLYSTFPITILHPQLPFSDLSAHGADRLYLFPALTTLVSHPDFNVSSTTSFTFCSIKTMFPPPPPLIYRFKRRE